MCGGKKKKQLINHSDHQPLQKKSSFLYDIEQQKCIMYLLILLLAWFVKCQKKRTKYSLTNLISTIAPPVLIISAAGTQTGDGARQ